MILYLVKWMLCMGLFLLLYLLLLEKEKMHRFKRIFLLVALLSSFIIPTLHFNILKEDITPVIDARYLEPMILLQQTGVSSTTAVTAQTDRPVHTVVLTLCLIYAIITLALLIRFIYNIVVIVTTTKKTKTIPYKGARMVLLKNAVFSHSFLRYIFINESDFLNNNIEEEIITHELAHVRQRHSFDILLVELIQVFFWFNPLLVLYKKAIRLNHEFLADDAVLQQHNNISSYQYLLLAKTCASNNIQLASSFYYSVTKKRLYMMTRNTSPGKAFAKQFAAMLALCAITGAFSLKIAAQQNAPSKTPDTSQSGKDGSKKPPFIHPMLRGPLSGTPYTKEGVSKNLLDEYLGIQYKYIDTLLLKKDPRAGVLKNMNKVTVDDRKRMETIFKQMSREQQSQMHILFSPPLKPASKNPPTQDQLDKWAAAKADVYGIWINDKRIRNEELTKYKSTDFSYYDASKLSELAVKNDGFRVQINIMANEYYDNYVKKTLAQKDYMMFFSSHSSK